MNIAILLLAVLLTSILSGVFGMGGGMILMAVLAVQLAPAAAIAGHGIIQSVANGTRALSLTRHVRRDLLKTYLAGTLVTSAIFFAFGFKTQSSTLLIGIGILGIVGPWLKKIISFNLQSRMHLFVAGTITGALQLVCGVSGPILDLVFLSDRLEKEEIVATKAAIQTIQHIIKVAYYLVVADVFLDNLLVPLTVAIPLSIVGTIIGKKILIRMKKDDFFDWSRRLIFMISVAVIVKAVANFQ